MLHSIQSIKTFCNIYSYGWRNTSAFLYVIRSLYDNLLRQSSLARIQSDRLIRTIPHRVLHSRADVFRIEARRAVFHCRFRNRNRDFLGDTTQITHAR